jgi:putative DNA-invertase from lambdoid prophage Rac
LGQSYSLRRLERVDERLAEPAERPQGRRLFDMLRSGETLMLRWVDRLGRNYADVCDTIREFLRRGVVIRTVINGLAFDGATTDR